MLNQVVLSQIVLNTRLDQIQYSNNYIMFTITKTYFKQQYKCEKY